LVRDTVGARALAPITMKGISREVIPYVVSGVLDATGRNIKVFSEHMTGLDLYFNTSMIDSNKAPHIREILQDALKALGSTK
jgi:adenylate cyclase